MDLSRVSGVSPEWKAALLEAGVATTADLARATRLDELSQRTGIPVERLDGLREAARQRIVTKLHEAGVGSEADLLAADPDVVAGMTDLTREDVLWFQAAAREAGLPPRRVTLRPGEPLARVRVEEDVHEAVPLRTLGPDVEPGAVLAAMDGNVVLLRAGRETAVARLMGTVHEELPLYAAGAEGETAVRVADVRTAEPEGDAPRKEKRGLFSRLRKT